MSAPRKELASVYYIYLVKLYKQFKENKTEFFFEKRVFDAITLIENENNKKIKEAIQKKKRNLAAKFDKEGINYATLKLPVSNDIANKIQIIFWEIANELRIEISSFVSQHREDLRKISDEQFINETITNFFFNTCTLIKGYEQVHKYSENQELNKANMAKRDLFRVAYMSHHLDLQETKLNFLSLYLEYIKDCGKTENFVQSFLSNFQKKDLAEKAVTALSLHESKSGVVKKTSHPPVLTKFSKEPRGSLYDESPSPKQGIEATAVVSGKVIPDLFTQVLPDIISDELSKPLSDKFKVIKPTSKNEHPTVLSSEDRGKARNSLFDENSQEKMRSFSVSESVLPSNKERTNSVKELRKVHSDETPSQPVSKSEKEQAPSDQNQQSLVQNKPKDKKDKSKRHTTMFTSAPEEKIWIAQKKVEMGRK